MASFGAALTFILIDGGTATVNHLNNPVVVGRGYLIECAVPIPVRMDRDTGAVLDVWETFSDTDWLSDQWVRGDGSQIPTPAVGTFGHAFDAMRASPGTLWKPNAESRVSYFYSAELHTYLLRLPNGLDVRPAFPAREMRALTWGRV